MKRQIVKVFAVIASVMFISITVLELSADARAGGGRSFGSRGSRSYSSPAIRKIIEPHVAELAAENATAQEIMEMEEILRRQEICIEYGENITETDSAFHNLMASATKNRVMERLIVALVDFLKQSRENYFLVGEHGAERPERSLEGHKHVLAAIKNGDGEAAHKYMMQHLEDIEKIAFCN